MPLVYPGPPITHDYWRRLFFSVCSVVVVAMQDCLEQVVAVGCANLNLSTAAAHANLIEQQKALCFDLKLTLGSQSSCLCHKCAPLLQLCIMS